MPRKKALSFSELLTGVEKIHKDIASQPGMQRWDPIRQSYKNAKTHAEMMELANRSGIFGKLPSGEPVRASLVQTDLGDTRRVKKNIDQGREFNVVLHPESHRPDIGKARYYGEPDNPYPDFGAAYRPFRAYDDYGNEYYPIGDEIEKALKVGKVGDPKAFYAINAERIDPGSPDPSMHGYRPQGTDLYSLIYDLSRAPGGQFNIMADALSQVNMARRLRNTLSHYFGHGGYGNVLPFAVEDKGRYAYSEQLFNQPIINERGEKDYLLNRVPGKVYDKLVGLTPRNVHKLTPEETAGAQLLREAQLANVYGPKAEGIDPFDMPKLRALAEPMVSHLSDKGSMTIGRAFGPHTVGRALTTEEAIKRIMAGESPEEISYDLLSRPGLESAKGRYAKGGLVCLAG